MRAIGEQYPGDAGVHPAFQEHAMEEILDAVAAARYVGLSTSTLAKMRLSGNGPAFLKLGRRVLYRRADLDAWLESRVARDTTDADARLSRSLTGRQPNGRRNPKASPVKVNVNPNCSVEEVARLLGVHKDTVQGWLKKGLVAIDH
jgi:excisionase family DNA binding protein